ncbi:hypothetical protein SAMN06295967_103163 [Belliella buryatensis]|uniref:Endonuclease n=1 Tax=Belliella buryatensis TaxID=1500549 RepID=A0A239BRB2_9BACT|nr:hypothetical protein [Belliella buryatensis]SNS09961.1 hypothetical protein SAMN06295967_103163 [Belliella buryatensis]
MMYKEKEYNAGKTQSTKGWRPWTLLHKEEVETREQARVKEIFLKSGAKKEFLKCLK